MFPTTEASGSATSPSARVSVCVPTIDRPEFFREAIASLASQSWHDFEIVVADNSGNAICQHRIDHVMAEFPNLRFFLVRHPTRVDVVSNFNSMIDAAQGEFWTCLPDDDRFCPNFLERSVAALDRHPECDFSFADHWIMGADGAIDNEQSLANSARYARTTLREGVYLHDRIFEIALKQAICLQTSLFRRPMIAALRFAPGISTLDQSLFLRMGACATPFNGFYLNERLVEYRLHAGQWSSTTRRLEFLRSEIAAFESVKKVPASNLRDFKSRLGRAYLALALLEAEEDFPESARAHALRSVALSMNLRNAIGGLMTILAPRSISVVRRLARQLRRRWPPRP